MSSATKSWSIDMQRYNFQFTGSIFRVEHGRLVGQTRDVPTRPTTQDFWGSLSRLAARHILSAARVNCGKGHLARLLRSVTLPVASLTGAIS